jgi:hypothetical protein
MNTAMDAAISAFIDRLRYNFHVLQDGKMYFAYMADVAFPTNIAFQYLDDLTQFKE